MTKEEYDEIKKDCLAKLTVLVKGSRKVLAFPFAVLGAVGFVVAMSSGIIYNTIKPTEEDQV